jgi:pimeloyl-ACP methyl ester carboxylesterase
VHEPLYEHRLELAGFTTRALELEGDGPPLLLLHGFADSADTWRLVLDLLARGGRRALALDLPGYGRADRLRDDEPVLEQYRAFTAEAVRRLSADHGDVVLCGNSLGGAIALRAGEDPSLPLAAVVPVAPAGLDMPVWFRVIEADLLLRGLLAAPVPVPSVVVRRVVGELYRTLAFARPASLPPGVVRTFASHHASRGRVLKVMANGRRLLPELTGCFDLGRVAVPVLLVWGDRDRMVTHDGARHVLEALPETTYELLDGVGHCPQLEAPQRLVAALDRFLDARTGARS